MRIKHLTALLLASCISVTAVPVTAPGFAVTASAETSGDFECSIFILEDGTVEIYNYKGTDTIVEIPAQIEGRAVTSIGESAFYGCKTVESVTIPDTVTSIGPLAFYDCTSLASVTIPESVTSIRWDSFEDTPWLQARQAEDPLFVVNGTLINARTCTGDVQIPESVTSIEDYAFSGCAAMTSVTIPESVTSISGFTFYYCMALTSVTIPESVTSIGDGAFGFCTSLTSVTIPESVTSIGYGAFENCNSDLTIHGYDGSTAQAYAEEYGYTFVSLGAAPAAGLLGDVDNSGEVDSVDASLVLVAAAALGLDQPSGLDAEAEKRADVDGNGDVNSVDASIILAYAAAQGLSETPLDLIDYVPKS